MRVSSAGRVVLPRGRDGDLMFPVGAAERDCAGTDPGIGLQEHGLT